MRKFGNIHILLHTQMRGKCECQSEILLKRLYRDLVPTHPRSVKITTKVVRIRSSKTIQTQHNVFVCYQCILPLSCTHDLPRYTHIPMILNLPWLQQYEVRPTPVRLRQVRTDHQGYSRQCTPLKHSNTQQICCSAVNLIQYVLHTS